MSGTGHAYEVLNVAAARDALLSFVDADGPAEAVNWFASPQLLRFATGPSFTARIGEDDLQASLALHISDEVLRSTLRQKASGGGEFRLFVPEFFRLLGPDFRHVGDWMQWLNTNHPTRMRKLRRMDVAAVIAAAEDWSQVRDIPPRGEGRQCRVEGVPGWIELLDEQALLSEGQAMKHCIGGYGKYLSRGDRMFSLRNHAGLPLVTVHLLSSGSGLTVGQVRAHSNAQPGPSCRQHIARLFNHLRVSDQPHSEARFAGLVTNDTGAWRTFQDVAERLEIGGCQALAYENELWVMDASAPDLTLLTAVGPEAGWHRGPKTRRVRFRLINSLTRCYAQLRRFADVANALCIADRLDALDGLKVVEGRFVPWPDLYERLEVAGSTVLQDERGILITAPDDLAHVLATLRRTGAGGTRLQLEVARRDWSAREARHLASVLTALRVRPPNTYEYTEKERAGLDALEAAGVECWLSERWAYLPDVTRRYPYGGKIPPDGRTPEWSVTDWRIMLRGPRRHGQSVTIGLDEKGRASWCTAAAPLEYLAETARFLNAQGIPVSPYYSVGGYRGCSWPRTAENGVAQPLLMNIRSSWSLVDDAVDLERKLLPPLQRRGKPARPTADDAQVALKMLPGPAERPDLVAFLTHCLEALVTSEAGRRSVMWLPPSSHAISALADREPILVRRAEELAAGMSPRGQKALGARVADAIAAVIGRSRHAGVFNGEPVARALCSFYQYLPRRTIERAVPWCLKLWDMKETKVSSANPDWLPLAEWLGEQEHPRALAAVRRSAGRLIWQASYRDTSGLALEDVLFLARCARLVAAGGSWYLPYGFFEGVAALRRLAEEGAETDHDAWGGILDMIVDLPQKPAARPSPPWSRSMVSEDAST